MKILLCPRNVMARKNHTRTARGVLRCNFDAGCFAAALICAKILFHSFFPEDVLELPDDEDDNDAKVEERDNELDASESARTSCSGFISMSRRGGWRRCQRWSAGCFPEDELEPPDEEDGDDAKDAHTIDLKFELCKVIIHLNTMDKGK